MRYRYTAILAVGLCLIAVVLWAAETHEYELGHNGAYDGTVFIRRDAGGAMCFTDASNTSVPLAALIHSGNWELQGSDLRATPTASSVSPWLTGAADLGSSVSYWRKGRFTDDIECEDIQASRTLVVGVDNKGWAISEGTVVFGYPAGRFVWYAGLLSLYESNQEHAIRFSQGPSGGSIHTTTGTIRLYSPTKGIFLGASKVSWPTGVGDLVASQADTDYTLFWDASTGELSAYNSTLNGRIYMQHDGTNATLRSSGGPLRLYAATGHHITYQMGDAAGATGVWFKNSGGVNKAVLLSNGRFGLGDPSPDVLMDVEGTSASVALLPGPSAAPADGTFASSQWALWLDEVNNEFELKARKSDGTVISQTVGSGGAFVLSGSNAYTTPPVTGDVYPYVSGVSFGNTNPWGNITSTGTIEGEHIQSTDDIELTDMIVFEQGVFDGRIRHRTVTATRGIYFPDADGDVLLKEQIDTEAEFEALLFGVTVPSELTAYTKRDGSAAPTADWDFGAYDLRNITSLRAGDLKTSAAVFSGHVRITTNTAGTDSPLLIFEGGSGSQGRFQLIEGADPYVVFMISGIQGGNTAYALMFKDNLMAPYYHDIFDIGTASSRIRSIYTERTIQAQDFVGSGTLDSPDLQTSFSLKQDAATAIIAGDTFSNDVTATLEADGDTALTIADNSVDGTDISLASEAAGDVMYFNGTDWVRLAKGTAGQVLEMNAGATAPEWDTDDTGSGASTGTVTWMAHQAGLGSSGNPIISWNSTHTHSYVLLDDSTDEYITFQWRCPDNWDGGNIYVNLQFTMASGITSETVLGVAVMAVTPGDAADIDTDSFDAATTSAETVPATAGHLDSVSFKPSLDGMAAGDNVTWKILREAVDPADNASGDTEIRIVEIEFGRS